MSTSQILLLIISVALFIYLWIAKFKPEWF